MSTIDHVAVPSAWQTDADRCDGTGLSDHDAYVVRVLSR